jgi:ABC-type transporter Mla subunit MlaD
MAVRVRRRTAVATATALLILTTAVGCDAVGTALDCVRTADALANSVADLQRAVTSLNDDPLQVDRALDDIDTKLNALKDQTGNADLSQAVDNLDKAVDNVRTAVDNGDQSPDLTPVTDAASEIGKICTP